MKIIPRGGSGTMPS